MAGIDRLALALAGDDLDRAITAAINRGDLCANCDGLGGYDGWTCRDCAGTGDGPNARYRNRVADQLAAHAASSDADLSAYAALTR